MEKHDNIIPLVPTRNFVLASSTKVALKCNSFFM